ncbi:MAG: DUF1565 domain-containing protein, partial [Caldimonas sp.]
MATHRGTRLNLWSTWARRWLAGALIVSACAGCGGGGDSATTGPATGNVGPAGAIVSSVDQRATLTVPAGAVSSPIDVTLSAATTGFTADPMIVAGTTYLIDAPDTALAADATFSIVLPPGAPGPAQVREPARKVTLAAPTLGSLIGCDVPVVSGVTPPAGTHCYLVDNRFDDPGTTLVGSGGGTVSPYCGVGPAAAIGATVEVGHTVVALLVTGDGTLYSGFVYICEVPPAPAPQIANVSLASPGLLASTFDPATKTVTAKVSLLSKGVMAVLLDTEPPVVTMSGTIVADGGGNAHYVISGTTSDNVGVVQVALNRIDAVNPQTLHITLTPVATLLPGAYSYTSAVMPLIDIQGKAFAVRATDSAGNVGANWLVLASGPPAISAFGASPASLPVGGGDVTLSWSSSGAATLSIDNGIGVVTGTSQVAHVTANTTFTLTATNGSGSTTLQANVIVASGSDRFVDPLAGSDANSCTQASPCKTIGKALTGAPASSAVYLADGSYPAGSATVPDGVAVRATHPGAATLHFFTFTAAGSASFDGLVFDEQGGSCSSL